MNMTPEETFTLTFIEFLTQSKNGSQAVVCFLISSAGLLAR